MDLNRIVFGASVFPRFPVRSSLFISSDETQIFRSSLTTPFLNRLPQQILCQRSEVDNSTWIFCVFLCLFQNMSNFNRLLLRLLTSLHFFLASSCFTQFHGNFYEFLASAVTLSPPQVPLLQRRMPSFFQIQQAPPPQNQAKKGSKKTRDPQQKTQNTGRMFFSANSKIKKTLSMTL